MMASSASPLVRILVAIVARRSKLRIHLGLAFSEEILCVVAGVGAPFLLKSLVDLLSHGAVSNPTLGFNIVVFVLLWSAPTLLAAPRLIHVAQITERLSGQVIRDALTSQLPRLAQQKGGDASSVAGALERLPFSLHVLIDSVLWRAGSLILQVALGLGALCLALPWRYALVLLSTVIVYAIASDRTAKHFHRQARRANVAAAALSRLLGDVVTNAQRVIYNGAASVELESISHRFNDRSAAHLKTAWLLNSMALLQFSIVGLGLSILLFMGGLDTIDHSLTLGDFILLQAYAFRLLMPISGFAIALRQADIALENIRECFAMSDAPPSTGGEGQFHKASDCAALTVRNISFGYDGSPEILKDLSVDISKGSLVAVVGPNGSGKSTFGRIMAGLLAPAGGEIWIGGSDLAGIPADTRHRHVLYVPQHIGLFNRTIGENGLYPPTRLGEGDLAGLLNAWKFYPDSRAVDLGAGVGDRGDQLSGGQVQKLEMARLHGVETAVLVLDECTSALDATSAHESVKSLRQSRRSTVIMITHHQEVAALADQVLFLCEGRIAGAGSHANLIKSNESYRAFWSIAP